MIFAYIYIDTSYIHISYSGIYIYILNERFNKIFLLAGQTATDEAQTAMFYCARGGQHLFWENCLHARLIPIQIEVTRL